MGWFDTHCHLDAGEFAGDRERCVEAALAAGVTDLLVPAVEVANFAAVRALTTRDLAQGDVGRLQKIRTVAAYGIHPMYTPQASEKDLISLRQWITREQPVAVGEIGLDGFVPGLDMARQEWFFVEQLKIARDFDLPVVLHLRRAQDAVLKHLRKIGVRQGIAHAFNGSVQQAEQFIKLGFKLGFGGAMTFAGSTRIRKLAAALPLEVLVVETDAPDIAPAWLAGGRNAPAELARIGGVLAELRGASPQQIAEATSANARSAFRLS